jgi:hypothetical protein
MSKSLYARETNQRAPVTKYYGQNLRPIRGGGFIANKRIGAQEHPIVVHEARYNRHTFPFGK